nr:MAG TPA: hypothetical protein [Caudoviricetes sp.]
MLHQDQMQMAPNHNQKYHSIQIPYPKKINMNQLLLEH